MTIARSDLSDNPCSAKFDTLSSNTLFDYAPTVYNLTLLYGCQLNPLDDFDADQYNFTCGNDKFVYYANDCLMETTSSEAITALCKYTLKVPIFGLCLRDLRLENLMFLRL
ncbi:hypothetical protein FEM48_Zijuj05G0102500 [Ziziphus jujuba var. spinosa]|uniref:Uncharacterized protein n=1 Tax=Ziziphus jujuba var. spinosa TaxID=714518 RepID=A0A978VED4_ZIZJJ|nr:hypothetical protein FEM48_Zijuj05G0102500 [Ziziphus jujuba var. spinosa]